MERALVTRLYRDEASQQTVMLMEGTQSKERIKVTIPYQKAGILALEAHGLNDRCPLYGMFSQCVGELGAAFGSVVLNCEGPRCTHGAISLSHDGRTSWIGGDVVELVAFAMHTHIPIYISKSGTSESEEDEGQPRAKTMLPSVFVDALEDIFSSESDTDYSSSDPSDR